MANRDPEATKARILAAAVREFSAKGISGARVDAIAARARVNKRMLYYYFESKEGLFREILRRRLVERSATLTGRAVSDPDRLAERTAADRGREPVHAPHHVGGARDRPRPPGQRGAAPLGLRRLDRSGRGGAARRPLPADLDAAQLVLSEMCLTMGPFLLPQLTQLVTGMSAKDPEFLARRQEFLRTLARRIGG